jgi:acetylornithine deacetylase/succinyl-diaminopimelate desuccinylase-like protein
MSVTVEPPKRRKRLYWLAFFGVLLALLGVIGVLAYGTLTPSYQPQAFPPGEFRFDEEHAARVLLSLLQEDTTNPPLRPEAFALSRERIINLLDREYSQPLGLEVRRRDPLYTAALKASGSTRDTIVLVTSADLPALNTEGWRCDPKGERHADELCGAGARYGKAGVVTTFEAVSALKKSGLALPFHVVVVVLFDSKHRQDSALKDLLVGLLPDKKVRVILDATSRIPQDFPERLLPISVTEKRGLWLRLFAEGPQGESSIPNEQYAAERLLTGLHRLSQWNKGGQRFLPSTAELSQRLGDVAGLPWSILYKNPTLLRSLALRRLSKTAYTLSMLQASVMVEAFAAASDDNSAPTLAEAKVEIRLLPDADPNAFLGELRQILQLDNINVEVLRMDAPAVESAFASSFFRIMEGAARQVFPQRVAAPIISPSDTPASVFAYAGLPVLRLPPPSTGDAVTEETVTTAQLRDTTEFLFQTMFGAALLDTDPFDDLVARRY